MSGFSAAYVGLVTLDQRTPRRSLSAHENRIGHLAATGHSNRAIGDDLGVSARAIEHHLTRVYQKLGIRRRADLPAALRRDSPAG